MPTRRGSFTLQEADAFVASVFNRGGMGALRRPLSAYTPAYRLRLANHWRRQAEAGMPLSPLREARGHGRTPEHPPQKTITYQDGHSRTIRTYRDPAAMLRWIKRLPGYPDLMVQVTAYGYPNPDSGSDRIAALAKTLTPDAKVWTTAFTGWANHPDVSTIGAFARKVSEDLEWTPGDMIFELRW